MTFFDQWRRDNLRRNFLRGVSQPLRVPSFTYKRLELNRQLPLMHALGVRDPVFEVNAKDDAYPWARSLGVRVPERLALCDRVADVPWDTLPDRFVLKPNKGKSSTGVFLLERLSDGWLNRGSGRPLSTAELVREYEQLVATGTVSEGLTIEELVSDPRFPGLPPIDYKVYSFYGTVGIIKVKAHSITEAGRVSRWRQFDAEWRDIGNAFHHYVTDASIPPPVHRDEVLQMARTVSAAIPRAFVRVDVFDTADGPVFGEVTPMPGDETIVTPKIDRMLGELWEDAEARLRVEIIRTGLLHPRVPSTGNAVPTTS